MAPFDFDHYLEHISRLVSNQPKDPLNERKEVILYDLNFDDTSPHRSLVNG